MLHNSNLPAASTNTNTLSPSLLDKPKVNLYHAHTCSLEFEQYKQTMGIEAAVYTASTMIKPANGVTSIQPLHDFISLLTYPTNPETLPYNAIVLNACNNKEDILTQSQMFKADDAAKFIECQADEINGLRKFDVMDICPISSLPPRARLLSSIWSYR